VPPGRCCPSRCPSSCQSFSAGQVPEFSGMLQRSQRPMTDGDRLVLERYRERDTIHVRLQLKVTFLAGAAGLLVGFLWLALLHWGDRSTPGWPILALVVLGAGAGFASDWRRTREVRGRRRACRAP
jgi:hypothetical protein